MGMPTEPDDYPFLPDERQRRLIEEATTLNKSSLEPGHFVPDELLHRMQSEEAGGLPPPLGSQSSGIGGSVADEQREYFITIGAALDEALPQEQLLRRLGPGFNNAKLYWRRPFFLAVECISAGNSRLEATLKVAEDIRAVFPLAEMVDVSSLPANLIAALDELSEDGVLTESALEGALGPFASAPNFRASTGNSAVWIEAKVFEVLDTPQIVHLRSTDNRIWAFNRRTVVWNGFEKVEEGQHFRCLIVGKFGIVLRAERILV